MSCLSFTRISDTIHLTTSSTINASTFLSLLFFVTIAATRILTYFGCLVVIASVSFGVPPDLRFPIIKL